MEPKIYLKPALAVLKERKILLVRDNVHGDKWFMLGGNQEEGETEVECLKREVQEEVNTGIKDGSLKFLKQFEDVAYGKEHNRVRMRLYAGELVGESVLPSAEILEARYFDSTIDEKHMTPISTQIFEWLKQNDYID